MKYIIITLTITLLLTSCADKNAFDKFNMQKDQELSADSLQSSKIKRSQDIDGLISAVYLNNIYPDIYNEHEYFYVYIYQKDKKEMYNPNTQDDIELTMKLNSKLPVKIKELSAINKFSHLTSVQSKWQRYFLVAFGKEDEDELNLILESGQSSSDALNYQKVKQ